MPVKHKTAATMRLLGGHPVLDFTNTVDSRGERYGPDVLRSFDDLLTWAARVNLLDTAEHAALAATDTPQALTRAKTLREALYGLLTTGHTPENLAILQHALHAAHQARTLAPHGTGFAWHWAGNDPHIVTHRLALAAADLLTAPAASRVRVCPGPNCAWLFLDTSRGKPRLWCSPETCGTRDRARRWRARQKAV